MIATRGVASLCVLILVHGHPGPDRVWLRALDVNLREVDVLLREHLIEANSGCLRGKQLFKQRATSRMQKEARMQKETGCEHVLVFAQCLATFAPSVGLPCTSEVRLCSREQ